VAHCPAPRCRLTAPSLVQGLHSGLHRPQLGAAALHRTTGGAGGSAEGTLKGLQMGVPGGLGAGGWAGAQLPTFLRPLPPLPGGEE
jgi:hypothetical protein